MISPRQNAALANGDEKTGMKGSVALICNLAGAYGAAIADIRAFPGEVETGSP
jgi:hypothetical protein